MVTRRSPAFTSAPSWKWMDWTAPATRERTSTRSTASRRPENSSHVETCDSTTEATITGVAGGAADAGAACDLPNVKRAAPAVTAIAAATATTRLRWVDWVLDCMCLLLLFVYRTLQNV